MRKEGREWHTEEAVVHDPQGAEDLGVFLELLEQESRRGAGESDLVFEIVVLQDHVGLVMTQHLDRAPVRRRR